MRFRSILISSWKYPSLLPVRADFCFEFHISKKARMMYGVDEALIESTGNVLLPNIRVVRELTYSINSVRGVLGNPEKEVRAGFLNAAGLLDEISHFLVRIYDEQENPGVLQRAYDHLESALGTDQLEKTLIQFLSEFPPKSVYQYLQTERAYFESVTSNRSHKVIALEELVMLFLSNINPAHAKIKELFDDTQLIAKTKYIPLIKELEQFLAGEKPFGPDNQHLLDALKKPIMEHPESIEAQLGYFKQRWGIILSPMFLNRIEGSLEVSKEEEKFIWNMFNPFKGKATVETFVPEYKKGKTLTPEEKAELLRKGKANPEDYIYAEPEQFTPDTDWMPNVVLIAKNIYVWLDQLSKKYRREIKRLDQIPDEELDQLARWNFTSLWLIGVWERSPSSKRIKQIMGNLDAVSSAYSLYDYVIAHDLGGEDAFQHLNRRCWERGIRLAGDMVPNHMGLYSKWVIEHPEYFIQTDFPPYPNYSFTGENLSHDPNIEIRIEDGYWSRRDAAVVFQRIDRRSGAVRYLYHGNDGTSMPWNDTAQLNLLRADVREAVIQNILHVARKFSVIRFDAAMTLAKKHFQRLWYPMPGTSGVPSRQDHTLSRAEFDAMFPTEFWREVVDRFNAEMPQTLLLAEAFWLMEGYFVRTLGMHRVYNSAFMHMLMKEENQKFRAMIKNTLEFNPEILKRYVNFMSNPDEQTAVEQFGKDDKYFGVATLMVTLPGLPMFAHGQMEGFTEKYGMEYQRAYYQETPDEWLIRRHEHEIFPLTRKRYLFSQVTAFEFYDFIDDRGFVNEDVIAYSNRTGNERAVIFFHNKFAECSGTINHALPKAMNEHGNVRSVTIGQSLFFNPSENLYYRFRNRTKNLEYLISGKDLSNRGIRLSLHAFEYAVFTEFREVTDTAGEYHTVAARLQGAGTDRLEIMLKEVRLQPFHAAMEKGFADFSIQNVLDAGGAIYDALNRQTGSEIDGKKATDALKIYGTRVEEYAGLLAKEEKKKKSSTSGFLPKSAQLKLRLMLYRSIQECRPPAPAGVTPKNGEDIFTQLHLDPVVRSILVRNGESESAADESAVIIKHLLRLNGAFETLTGAASFVDMAFNDYDTADLIGVHQYQDEWYFNKERFEALIQWMLMLRAVQQHGPEKTADDFGTGMEVYRQIMEAAEKGGYTVERVKELAAEPLPVKKAVKKRTEKGNNGRKKKQSDAKLKSLSSRSLKVKSTVVKNITKAAKKTRKR